MAGRGKRFNDVAFHGPKPLIEIDGKPMIEHVINIFSHEDEFIFICHEFHLANTNMRDILLNLVPNCKIVSVNDDQMNGGPIYSCLNVFPLIKDDEEVIVNYCDFTLQWNYQDFKSTINDKECDGAIVSFRGFHPASLGDTYYAYLKVDGNKVVALQEKQPYSQDRMNDFASTGTYYFRKGSIFKKYAKEVVNKEMSVKGEAYVTLPYILMLEDGLNVLNYEVERFICLGTPRDYEVYKFWSEFFFRQSGEAVRFNNVNLKTTNIFPIAGDKRDFVSIGVDAPNFLIPLMNRPLIRSTVSSHPQGIRNIFIALSEHAERYNLDLVSKRIFHNSEVLYLNQKTQGNAFTILETENLISNELPVCVSGNSYILDYDQRRLAHLMENKSVDVILLSFTHHECVLRNPNRHSYLKLENDRVQKIFEKRVISQEPYKDHVFTGTAIYRRSENLFSSIKKHVAKPGSNNSFLTAINELIDAGKKVVVFEVDKFISLLTPEDYQEFIYWQEYFDGLIYHPYSKMVH
tara:strand:- start:3955 stop:5511 length:1557 start_codon:yes stop_codon:yes gene_type:complete